VPDGVPTDPARYAVRVPLRVRFGETDAVGVVGNAVYLSYLEVGRIEYLRALGRSYAALHEGGLDMVVTEAHLRYLRPLRFDDELEVLCACTSVGRASFVFAYLIERAGETCARAMTRHACIDSATLRPLRIPGWLAEEVERFEATTTS
jgi:acyl-CoA thioester hydrolase